MTPISGNPRALRGFFIGGPSGAQYREDFNRTLQKHSGCSEFSVYRFIEGAFTGGGGICASAARRVD